MILLSSFVIFHYNKQPSNFHQLELDDEVAAGLESASATDWHPPDGHPLGFFLKLDLYEQDACDSHIFCCGDICDWYMVESKERL